PNEQYTLSITAGDTVLVLSYSFRTSEYETIEQKIADIFPGNTFNSISDSTVIVNYTKEPFDTFELEGAFGGKPLITMEADTDNDWYRDIYTNVYEDANFMRMLPARYDTYGSPATGA